MLIVGKVTVLQEYFLKSYFLSILKALKCFQKKNICLCTKELSVVGGQAFLSSFKKYTEVIIFPQAQWTMGVNYTDSDYFN